MSLQWSDWEEEEWEQFARCKGSDTNIFFKARGLDHFKARQICAGCSVQEQCREFAVTTNQSFGYWGSTANDRMIERRNRRIEDE